MNKKTVFKGCERIFLFLCGCSTQPQRIFYQPPSDAIARMENEDRTKRNPTPHSPPMQAVSVTNHAKTTLHQSLSYNMHPNIFSLNFFCIFFWQTRVCSPLPCVCRTFMIFERCLNSNSECCRSMRAPYKLSHPSPYLATHPLIQPFPILSHPFPYLAST